MSQNKIFYLGQWVEQEILDKMYTDAKTEIYNQILLELEGLQSVADHLDDKNAFRVNKYIDRIKNICK